MVLIFKINSMNFNDYCWHDAIIKNIKIDRSNPGITDIIIFDIEWPNEKGNVSFVFEEVYWAEMRLNFGIVADETILNSTELDNSNQDLVNFYSKWKGAMDDVELKTYKIELNSTGGEIKIIAKKIRIDNVSVS
jgi:hypothetical protein